MIENRTLNPLLSGVPEKARFELLSFLAFSERRKSGTSGDVIDELLVSLSFFNAVALRPN